MSPFLSTLWPYQTDPTSDPSPEEGLLPDEVDVAVEKTFDFLAILGSTLAGAVAGFLVAMVVIALVKVVAHRHPVIRPGVKKVRMPIRVFLTLIGAWVAFAVATPENAWGRHEDWRVHIFHAFMILAILTGTWVLAKAISGFEDSLVAHVKHSGTKRAKRIQTQSQIVRRVLVLIVWIVGFAGVLITFPAARAAGASLLASAGLISVVAGLAAQSTLGNIFAGLQVAFTDSLRVDDIVIMNGEYCVVEEITLTYVVLKVWDGRRIIVPSSKLTGEVFENWTRRAPDLMGSVRFDLDWQIPVDAMRSEFLRVVKATDLWDGEVAVLRVYDAEGGLLKIDCLVSARDSGVLTDLKYYVRENMVKWIQKSVPRAIPYTRHIAVSLDEHRERMAEYPDPSDFIEVEPDQVEEEPAPAPTVDDMDATMVMPLEEFPKRVPIAERPEADDEPDADEQVTTTGHESSLFTGSEEAEKRGREFSGPERAALVERERSRAERNDEDPDTAVRNAGLDEPEEEEEK